jgi:hypothetical protein
VASASDGHEEIALAREPDRRPDIGDAGAARDERGPAVDRAIPDATGSLVLRVAGPDQLAAELSGEVGECGITEHRGAMVGSSALGEAMAHLLCRGRMVPAGVPVKNKKWTCGGRPG